MANEYNLNHYLADLEEAWKGDLRSFLLRKHPASDELGDLGSQLATSEEMYISVGGPGGSGKTGFVIHNFVMTPFIAWQQGKFNKTPMWYWWNTERPLKYVVGRMHCWLMFFRFGKIIGLPTLFNLSNRKWELTDIDKQQIANTTDELNLLLKHIRFHTGRPTFEDLQAADFEKAKALGTFEGENYTRTNTSTFIFRIIDHVNNVLWGNQGERKTVIDISDQSSLCRDKYGWCVVDISQFNQEIFDTYRQMKTRLRVRKKDWFGSSKISNNADIMLGILDPKEFDLNRFMGYDLTEAESRIRGVWVCKNSYDQSNTQLPFLFFGESGFSYELGEDEDLTNYLNGIF